MEHLETERKRECEQSRTVLGGGLEHNNVSMLSRLAPYFKQVINRFWERKGLVGILTRLLGDRNHGHDFGGARDSRFSSNILST